MKAPLFCAGLSVVLALSSVAADARMSMLVVGGGSEAGNGGDAVVCRDTNGAITSVEILDHYEARVMRGIQLDLGGPELDETGKVKRTLNRLVKNDPERVERYSALLNHFMEEALFLSGVQLVDIPDSNHIAFPFNCRVEQVAIWKEKKYPEDKVYTINKDLWDRMDRNSRAGLILHEIIYRAENPDNGSGTIRYFASLLASKKIDEATLPTYVGILKTVNFKSIRIGGVLYQAGNLEFYPSGRISSGTLLEPRTAFQHGTDTFFFKGDIAFAEDGTVRSGELAQHAALDLLGKKFTFIGKVEFGPSGNLRSGTISEFTDVILNDRNVFARCATNPASRLTDSAVTIGQDGAIESLTHCVFRISYGVGLDVGVRADRYEYRSVENGDTWISVSGIQGGADVQTAGIGVQGKGRWLLRGGSFELKNRRVQSATFTRTEPFQVGRYYLNFSSGVMRFHSQATIGNYDVVSEGTIDGTYTLPTDTGEERQFSYERLAFDVEGRVITQVP